MKIILFSILLTMGISLRDVIFYRFKILEVICVHMEIECKKVKTIQNEIDESIEEIRTECNKIYHVIEDISHYWTGETSKCYIVALEDNFIPFISDLIIDLINYNNLLKEITNTYDKLDQDYFN